MTYGLDGIDQDDRRYDGPDPDVLRDRWQDEQREADGPERLLGGRIAGITVPAPTEPGTTTCLRCRARFEVGDVVMLNYVVRRIQGGVHVQLDLLIEHVACSTARRLGNREEDSRG